MTCPQGAFNQWKKQKQITEIISGISALIKANIVQQGQDGRNHSLRKQRGGVLGERASGAGWGRSHSRRGEQKAEPLLAFAGLFPYSHKKQCDFISKLGYLKIVMLCNVLSHAGWVIYDRRLRQSTSEPYVMHRPTTCAQLYTCWPM